MRYLLKALLVVCLLAPIHPMLAQDEGPPVPVEKAAYHWPIFSNDYVMLLRVYMRPGKGSNFHIHSLDQISILVEAGANEGQVFGKTEKIAPKAGTRGSVGFTALLQEVIHPPLDQHRRDAVQQSRRRAAQAGPRHLHAAGARRSGLPAAVRQRAGARVAAAARARAQTAGPITQTAPGLRVIIDGDELQEIIKGEMDRPLALRSGDFYWQEPGATRAIRNSGTTAINLVEFELK